MSIEKVKHGDKVPYVQVYHALLYDKDLSLKEKGLLAYMLSKPEDWQFNVKSMGADLKENKDTIAAILRTLIEKNYIQREEIRDGGRIKGFEYCVYQSPHPKTSDTVKDEVKTASPYPKTPEPVSSDIPNKERQIKKEREGRTTKEPTRDPPPESLKSSELFDKMHDVREIYHDRPPRLNDEEKELSVKMAKKYTATVFLNWLGGAASREPGLRLSWLFDRFGGELKIPPAAKPITPATCEECGSEHPAAGLLDWYGKRICHRCARAHTLEDQATPELAKVGR